MIILMGKTVYLCVWLFLLSSLIYPYPYPANFLIYVALATMTLVHGLQAWLLSSTLTSQEREQDRFKVLRVFIFGVFEVLSWKQKKIKK